MSARRPPAFDPEIIASLREHGEADGPDFLQELLDMFLEDSLLKLDDFDAALRCGNADWLMRSAHELGGSAGNVGAAGLSALCRSVELQARSGGLEGIQAGLMRIRDEFEAVSGEAAKLFRNDSRDRSSR
jgi:histidine phosphotransfer protein HptB